MCRVEILKKLIYFLRAVILDDVQVIREALNNSAVAGRADSKIFNHYAGGKHGMTRTSSFLLADAFHESCRYSLLQFLNPLFQEWLIQKDKSGWSKGGGIIY
jgi:hypothetical protein